MTKTLPWPSLSASLEREAGRFRGVSRFSPLRGEPGRLVRRRLPVAVLHSACHVARLQGDGHPAGKAACIRRRAGSISHNSFATVLHAADSEACITHTLSLQTRQGCLRRQEPMLRNPPMTASARAQEASGRGRKLAKSSKCRLGATDIPHVMPAGCGPTVRHPGARTDRPAGVVMDQAGTIVKLLRPQTRGSGHEGQ